MPQRVGGCYMHDWPIRQYEMFTAQALYWCYGGRERAPHSAYRSLNYNAFRQRQRSGMTLHPQQRADAAIRSPRVPAESGAQRPCRAPTCSTMAHSGQLAANTPMRSPLLSPHAARPAATCRTCTHAGANPEKPSRPSLSLSADLPGHMTLRSAACTRRARRAVLPRTCSSAWQYEMKVYGPGLPSAASRRQPRQGLLPWRRTLMAHS